MNNIKTIGVVTALSSLSLQVSMAADKRPNVVIFLADDMGYSDIGCYGSEIKTPNLDRLASEGIRLTQFMNNSKSAPTRASLLTGLYAIEAGCSGAPEQMINCMTIGEILSRGGYNTGLSGKWHAKEIPAKRGFQDAYGCVQGAFNYFQPTAKQKYYRNDKHINPITPENKDTFYTTDVFTDEAIGMLDKYEKEDKPFFLYVAYNAPHYPMQAWEEDIAKYRGKYMIGWDKLREQRFERQKELGIIPESAKLSERDEIVEPWESFPRKDDADITMATYAAMVDRLDQNIGRVMAKLDDMGVADNTLVIFMSDNGANAERQMWDGVNEKDRPGGRTSQAVQGDEWANASNTPYRKFKRYMYNGGQFTPFIARWPEKIKGAGDIIHAQAHLVDLYPTILEMAGIEYPEGETMRVPQEGKLLTEWRIAPLSGESILSLLESGEPIVRQRELMGYFQGARMVMSGDWKLVSDGGDGAVKHIEEYEWELYNMKDDVTEMNNLVRRYPKIVDTLDLKYRAWIASAEKLAGVDKHTFYVSRMSREEAALAPKVNRDKKLQGLLAERETIGGKIVAEIDAKGYEIKRGLGMEKVPMSYFGLVNEGRSYAAKSPQLTKLYEQWDANVASANEYCRSKGDLWYGVWAYQEAIRPFIPQSDLENN